jgi:hypothetical protein
MGILPASIKGIIRSNFLLLFALMIPFFCLPAHAAEPPQLELLKGEYKYRISWNGIKIGRVSLFFEETPEHYRVLVDTKTSGIVRMFHPLKSTTIGEGRKIEGRYVPEFYHANSDSDDGKGRTAKLYFDPEGNVERREVNPLDDPNWRPVVPLSELTGALDPVSTFFVMRQEISANIVRDIRTTRVHVYDGRRLAEISVRAVNAGTKRIHDKVTPMLNTVITRKPINGYTPKELKKFEAGDPVLHLYFSRDNRFVPIAAEAYLRFGTIAATLEERD